MWMLVPNVSAIDSHLKKQLLVLLLLLFWNWARVKFACFSDCGRMHPSAYGDSGNEFEWMSKARENTKIQQKKIMKKDSVISMGIPTKIHIWKCVCYASVAIEHKKPSVSWLKDTTIEKHKPHRWTDDLKFSGKHDEKRIEKCERCTFTTKSLSPTKFPTDVSSPIFVENRMHDVECVSVK